MKNVAVIGMGPAGAYFALKLLEYASNLQITVYDFNPPLSTIIPTGNFRCNLTYMEPDFKVFASNYLRGEKFLYSVFSRYGALDTIYDFEKIGIKTVVQNDLRVFPEFGGSKFVRDKILSKLNGNVTYKKEKVEMPLKGYDCTVLATGLKYGANLAKKYGHTVIPLKPSLTGLKILEKEFSSLEGVSFNGCIFTKDGVSGPFIYKLSSYNAYANFPYKINIPLVSSLDLKTFVRLNPKKSFKTALSAFIPKSLANFLVKEDKQCANVSNKEIEAMETLTLTAISVDNKGEIVHAGGVSLDELDKNYKSKIVQNLWVIGELVNIDGFCGGFNLQNCWSGAAIAAEDAAKTLS